MSNVDFYLSSKCFYLIISLLTFIGLSSCGSDSDDEDENSSSTSVVYMWVSTTTRNGNLGGVSGADNICVSNSSGVTFATNVATHRAVIGSSTSNPKNYFSSEPTVQRPNGITIVSSWSDFFDRNVTVSAVVSGSILQYHTGLDSNGNVSSNTCNDWTTGSSSSSYNAGLSLQTDRRRYNNQTGTCNGIIRVLCISY